MGRRPNAAYLCVNPGNPETDQNNVTRQIIIAIALLALAVVVWRVSYVLVVGFGGIVLAAVLRAIAVPLSKKTGLGERWAVLVVVLILAIGAVALGWLFGQQVATQTTELQDQLPKAFDKLVGFVERTDTGKAAVEAVQDAQVDSKTLSNVGIAATAALGGIADVLLVLFLSVYFAVAPELYFFGALRLLPPKYRGRVGRAFRDAGGALQKWLLGQVIAMLTVGVLVGVGMAIVGVPLPLVLGILASLLEFVPVIGPILFSIPGLLLAFAKGPHTVMYALIVYIVVQQLEGNVLIPLLQRWAVRLPPVVGLLAVVAGGFLLGVPGIVFATPLAVVIMRLVQHLYVEETLENGSTASVPNTRAATQ